MNSVPIIPTPTDAAMHRVEFFRLPAPGKRDPHFAAFARLILQGRRLRRNQNGRSAAARVAAWRAPGRL